jgi:transposase-like protein
MVSSKIRGDETMPATYPIEFKRQVIRRYEKGESIKSLSQELHISQSTIYHWRKLYCSIQTAQRIYTPKELDAISRRLLKLEHEMEIIQQAGYLAEVPLSKKLSTLEDIYRQPDNSYSVHELCEALGVARGTFYNHIFRRADRSHYKEEQAQLMLKVQQVFDDHQQRFGAKKIQTILAQSGVSVSAKRVSEIM